MKRGQNISIGEKIAVENHIDFSLLEGSGPLGAIAERKKM
jgi:hypothetical protein